MIIGAPFKITDKLIKDLNVSVIVKSLDVTQGSVKSEALELKPYEVAEQKDMLTEIDMECTITLKEIAERVAAHREAIQNKVTRSSAKQHEYEQSAKFV